MGLASRGKGCLSARVLRRCALRVEFLCLALHVPVWGGPPAFPAPSWTVVAKGPLRVDGNHIVDATGAPFLIRGTQLPAFPVPASSANGSSEQGYGPYSATTFSTIRLRWNMNAVRLPVSVPDCESNPACLPGLARVVRRANELELTAILAAEVSGAEMPSQEVALFWSRCAAFFRDYPNAIFDAFSEPTPDAIPGHNGGRHPVSEWQVWLHGGETTGAQKRIRPTAERSPTIPAQRKNWWKRTCDISTLVPFPGPRTCMSQES